MKLLLSIFVLLTTLSACSGQDQMAKANELLRKQQFVEAEAAFSEIVKADATHAGAWNGLANARMQQGKWDLCMADFAKAIEIAKKANAPRDTIGSYAFDKGFAHYVQAQFIEAKAEFLYAVECGYKVGDTYAYLGVNEGNMGEDLEALDYLNKAVKADPKCHFAWSNRGYYNSKVGDNKMAIFDFNKAIELMPDDKVSYLNRGYTYIGMGDYATALKDIDKALELDSAYLGAIAYKGIILTNTNQSAEGISWLSRAIDMQPENPAFYYYRGVALINSGQIDKGCSDLAVAAEGGNYDGEVMRKQFCLGTAPK
ncbi:MAG TPA: tetratricopeptide repeat protein [Bacteroidia bacterium]|nr:tetratricopeptide repeat protein [Bacteroidia bacterium]